LKTKGVIPNKTRALVRTLVGKGVPVSQVSTTINAVAVASGVTVEGSLSKRSVGRIMVEGYVASKIQLVDDITQAEGITLSGDGTTHKHVNYESRNIYINNGDSHVRRFLGIHSAHNHTSEVQLEGWKAITANIYKTYNASPHGQQNPQDARKFLTKVTGANTDHAEDQKKLVALIRDDWKVNCDHSLWGERVLASMSKEVLLPILQEEFARTVEAAGGATTWSQMSESEQDALHHVTLEQVKIQLGEAQYAQCADEEKQHTSPFVWGGCCMHKDLNVVKGGNAQMITFWEREGLTGPVLLMNRGNHAAATLGDAAARSRAEEVSEGGGIKATKLAGAIFRHKDDKKGQQDSFQIFFEASSAVGAMVHFPDTSNTRYQSHCTAAEELLFLEAIRDKKDNHTFNHMEANLFKALHDIPTLTELAVLALYSQAICHPYLRQVCGPKQEHTNLLDLGPLHNWVKAHSKNIAENPLLLLAPDASYSTGALDGEPWERPEVIYTIHQMQLKLPHLSRLLAEFCKGALATWERFSTEFAAGGVIDNLSSADRKKAWVRATNNDNEGALGSYRVSARQAPSMSVHQYNARTLFKINDTATYIEENLGPANQAFLRERAREIDASGLEKQRRKEQADEDHRIVTRRRELNRIAEARREAKQDRLAALKVILDLTAITEQMNVVELQAQIDWHRQCDTDKLIPQQKEMRLKAEKLQALRSAVERFTRR
ncbi:hypothetical protein WOLCODRAFT_38477, partial [Wolfiporia cocos MD-104 SS10]